MPLFKLLRSETALNVRRMLAMAVIASLSNAMVLAIINSAAGAGRDGGSGKLRLAVMFAIVLVAYTLSQRYLMIEASKELERIIHRIRTRLIEAVRGSELPEIERIGRTRIYNAVSNEIQKLAQWCNVLVLEGLQMGLLVVFTTLYLMTLSMTAFFLATGFMITAVVLYLARTKKMNASIDEANKTERRLHTLLTSVLDGFKEIKLNEARSDAVAADVIAASFGAGNDRAKAQTEFARNYIFTQNVFFLLLGTMVFIVPTLTPTHSDVLVKTTTAVLFVIGPIAGLVASLPVLANANASAADILELAELLSQHNGWTGARAARTGVPLRAFREITFRGVEFHFSDAATENPFHVGPFNLTLRAGETVFISGGNGSGKSTFLRLLTTLYWPQRGTILVDGHAVTHENVESYRALFSSVFSDYHLFKRLYGIEQPFHDEGEELLERFEIADKTSLVGDEFSTIELSAGQRKRLALIVAMLERRPICVLDEWAADQDPVFRRKFYVELLGTLKARGMTVIAVSHDDRYYDVADHRLHMEDGRMTGAEADVAHA
ncbi:MAG: cyclic peptide export ABC transporter [Candidatus Eremiobacteraeota bacterium]|nr:cyclic peptide export ABC transporter [Candidatus Eremiobacteraeota bacterium]